LPSRPKRTLGEFVALTKALHSLIIRHSPTTHLPNQRAGDGASGWEAAMLKLKDMRNLVAGAALAAGIIGLGLGQAVLQRQA